MARANRAARARGEGFDSTTKIEPPQGASDVLVVKSAPVPQDNSSDDGESFAIHTKVAKAVGERIVFGVIMRPNVIDAHDEFVDEALVKKTAHDFLAGLNTDNGLGVQHQDFTRDLDVVESTIETHDYVKHGVEVKAGDWTGSVRVNDDEIWAKVEKSELTGFSIGGRGTKRAATEDELSAVLRDEKVAKSREGAESQANVLKYTSLKINEWSLVDAPANEISFVVAKRRSKDQAMKTENAETPKDDKTAELAAANAKIAELEAKISESSKPAETPASASANTPAETSSGESSDKPSESTPASAPNAAPADASATSATNNAEPVAKDKRLTGKRKAELKDLHDRLGKFLADADDELKDGDSSDQGPELVQKQAPAATQPATITTPTPAASQPAPQVDVAAEIRKALEVALVPLNEKIEAQAKAIAEHVKTIGEQAKELEVMKSVRLPATRGTGNNVQKDLGNTDIWASANI